MSEKNKAMDISRSCLFFCFVWGWGGQFRIPPKKKHCNVCRCELHTSLRVVDFLGKKWMWSTWVVGLCGSIFGFEVWGLTWRFKMEGIILWHHQVSRGTVSQKNETTFLFFPISLQSLLTHANPALRKKISRSHQCSTLPNKHIFYSSGQTIVASEFSLWDWAKHADNCKKLMCFFVYFFSD